MKPILLILILAVFIAGCGNDVVIEPNTEDKTINTPTNALEKYELAIRTLNSDLFSSYSPTIF